MTSRDLLAQGWLVVPFTELENREERDFWEKRKKTFFFFNWMLYLTL